MKPYSAYKPSGVPWLGDVPGHWAVERIRFRATLNPGASRQLDGDALVSFLPMEAIGDDGLLNLDRVRTVDEVSSGYTYFEERDVAIAKITPCFENGKGAVMQGLCGGAGFGTTELIVMRPDARLFPKWLYYLTMCQVFRSPGEAMMLGAGGQKRVPDLFVKDYSAAFPSIDEQQAIAEYLDIESARIDELIREKKGLIEILEEVRAAVFATVLARLAGAASFSRGDRFPWLPCMPSTWEATKVKYLTLSVDQGISPQCEAYPPGEGEWGVLKVGCVNTGDFDPSESKALPSDIEPIEDITLTQGDVVISRANTKNLVGRAAMADRAYSRLMLSDKHYRLRLDVARCEPAFLVYLLAHPWVRARIEERATGASASMLNIDRRTILDLDVPLPPRPTQCLVIDDVKAERESLAKLIAHTQDEIRLLKELRAATIADAVLGRIDVRPAIAAGQPATSNNPSV